jgi:tRNA-splicing ligase RtcB (3'-phosphate/5'-hydroxy nucleic acid ligase)
MGDGWRGPLERIDPFRYEIPRSYKPAMRTSGLIFIDEPMMAQLRQDQAPEQVANVATMPGIVGKAMAMPDIHWGYGFPIGGVAAFDYDEGVISPGGIGYDLNCLSGETRVLTAHGYRLPIAQFERTWRKTSLACVNPRHRTRSTDIAAYMRFNARTAYRVRTSLGIEITATPDHPFLTPEGMIPLREVGDRPIAVYPFKGVDYEEPSAENLLTEEEIERSLSSKRRAQIVPFLRQKGLLPLTPSHPSFPYLVKLFGLALGDGHASLLTKTAGIVFWGREADLEDVRKDLTRLGWASRIYTRRRRHKITQGSRQYTFEYEEASLRVPSTALAVVLHALGLPVGNKAKQDFVLPGWLLRAPLWQKRLFLAALFAAEMSTPKTFTGHGYNFYCPRFSVSKREGFQASGRVFANQIRRLVNDFGVRVHRVTSDVLKVPGSGEQSYRFKVLIAGDSENLIRFYSTVNFEYHAEKRYLANAAAFYLTLKEMVLRETDRSARIAKDMRARGVPWDEILENLAGLYTRRSSLVHRLDGRVGKPRAWKPFPTFPEFLERLRSTGGTSGVVWDRIATVEAVPVGEVYDFTVTDRHHNFIADGFVVSNCGVRLLRTDLTEEEVRPRLKALTDACFDNVPSGVGEGGLAKVSRQDLSKLATEGVGWAVEKGYAWPEDPNHIEARGRLDDADFSKVSERAVARGKDQVGSLGAGNHFVEIQKIDRVFDERAAKAMGIGDVGTVCVMIHTGSRGFGHQIATDYIEVCERVVKREKIELPDLQLACAPIGSKEGQDYWRAMCCGANFAWNNRQLITFGVRNAFSKVLSRSAEDLGMDIVYDVCHNIGKLESHEVDGKRRKVVVHRKGATRAFPAGHPETPPKYKSVGQPVLIPGDMGTCSFVLVGVEGAMERSFGSSCHGAGRQMSRKAATRRYNANEVVRSLDQRGIYLRAASRAGIVEEAPGAYKNVEDVVRVAEGAGLTRIVARLVPLGVVKG